LSTNQIVECLFETTIISIKINYKDQSNSIKYWKIKLKKKDKKAFNKNKKMHGKKNKDRIKKKTKTSFIVYINNERDEETPIYLL